MNRDKKIAILSKIRAKGFRISHELEQDLTDSFETFYEERIHQKEEIIRILREIENKFGEKKIPNLNEHMLLAILEEKMIYDNAMPLLLGFYSLN